jgi:hypothetical protein
MPKHALVLTLALDEVNHTPAFEDGCCSTPTQAEVLFMGGCEDMSQIHKIKTPLKHE